MAQSKQYKEAMLEKYLKDSIISQFLYTQASFPVLTNTPQPTHKLSMAPNIHTDTTGASSSRKPQTPGSRHTARTSLCTTSPRR
jgi:hypothetical protein